MNNAPKHIYEFGPFRVDPRKRLLLHNGNQVRLPAKAFEILLVLLEGEGRLVEKDELMRRVWPDAVVEENNLTVNMSALRRSLTESRGEHRYVVTVPGRGYQFVADVQQLDAEPRTSEEVAEFPVAQGNGDARRSSSVPTQTNDATTHEQSISSAEYLGGDVKRHKQGVLFLLIPLLAIPIVFSYLIYSRFLTRPSKAAITSIAVLPFENETGDSNAEYLSDGISESLINNLSQLPDVKVIARSSAFKYRATNYDLQDVAKALSVEAILTGKVTQRGDNLAISVELVRASDKTQMWGAHYDRKMSDVLAIQREIASEIVEKLKLKFRVKRKDLPNTTPRATRLISFI